MNKSIEKLLVENAKPTRSHYAVYMEKIEGMKKKRINAISKKNADRYRLKVYSPEQIPNLELIAKTIVMESFTCGESEQPYLTSPTLKVYSPTQVHNLEKIARGDFRSDLGVKVVARREKATTHKRRMAR